MNTNKNEDEHNKRVGQAIRCGTAIESKLKELGANGKGLFELFKSVEYEFSNIKKDEFYFLIKVRNNYAHQANYEIKNFDKFSKKCDGFTAYLNQKIENKKRFEEEQKRIEEEIKNKKRIEQETRERIEQETRERIEQETRERIEQEELTKKRNKIIFIFIFGVIILGILFFFFKNSKEDIINEISSYQKNENHYITEQIDLSKQIITLNRTIKQNKDQQNLLRNLFNDTDEIDELEEKLDNLKEEKDTLQEKIKDTKENIKDLQNKL